MKIEIKSTEIQTIEGTSVKTGRPYCIRKQSAWLHLGKAYPLEIELNLEANTQAHPVGVYSLSPESYYVDRNKNLCVRPVLVSATPSAVLDKKAG